MNITEIRNAILTSDLTVADTRVLTDAIKIVRDRLAQDNIQTLCVNQRVKWVGKSKVVDLGTVKKIARANVTVLADKDGQLWRIPAAMLQAA
jgi:hypothetical protein